MYLTTYDLIIEAQTTDAVKTVYFEAVNPLWGDFMSYVDNNGSDGFSCSFNLTMGLYQLMIVAYDNNSNLVDYTIIASCLYLRLGASAPPGHLQQLVRLRL